MVNAARNTAMLMGMACLGIAQGQSVPALLTALGRSNAPVEQAALLNKLGRAELQAGNEEEALDYLQLCRRVCMENDLRAEESECRSILATYLAPNAPRKALAPALEAFALNDGIDSTQHAASALLLADLYVRMGAPARALAYLDIARAMTGKESLRSGYMRMRCLHRSGNDTEAQAIGLSIMRMERSSVPSDIRDGCLGLLATIAAEQGRNEEALQREGALIESALLNGDMRGAAISANNNGQILARQGDHMGAVTAYKQALSFLATDDSLREDIQLNMAVALGRQRAFNEALELVHGVSRSATQHNRVRSQVRAMLMESGLRLSMGQYDEAMTRAIAARSAARSAAYLDLEAEACDMLGEALQRQGRSEESLQMVHTAADLRAMWNDQLNTADDAASAMAQEEDRVLDALRDRLQARNRYRELMLATQNQEKELALARARMDLDAAQAKEAAMARDRAEQELLISRNKLESERRDRTIRDLENQSTMQALGLAKAQADDRQHRSALELLSSQNKLLSADNKLRAAKSDKQRLITIGSGVLVIFFAAFGFFMFRAFRRSRANNRTISKQRKELESLNVTLSDKNKELLSSLTYASHIQSSIVPRMNDLERELPGSFIFYRPQAAVSGDLPFMRVEGGRLFVAAIDCTGHGVPAAMLSFIAYYNLNQLITAHPGIDCGDLLGMLHQRVQATMRSRGSHKTLDDGMDMGIAIIDLRSGAMQFAGAQHAALIITANGSHVIKGSIRSIGDSMMAEPPTYATTRITLGEGDRCYLYTDGVIHQFNDEGRKFSTKRLHQLMQEMGAPNGEASVQRVSEVMTAWQGEAAQTDDMLLIGIRYSNLLAAERAA